MDIVKRNISKNDLEALISANDEVKDTSKWHKYLMAMEYKTKENGRWSNWKFIGYGIPIPCEMTVKKVNENIYIIRKTKGIFDDEQMERYALTDDVNKILKVYEG